MYEHPASGSLRNRSPEELHELLLTDLVEGEQEWLKDSRDLMMVLAPYHHCAQQLGLDVAATFRAVAHEGPDSLRAEVTAFGERRDVRPQAFGFEVVDAPGGPSYQRLDVATEDEMHALREWLGEE